MTIAAASAQTSRPADGADIREIPVVEAIAQPRVGEQVVDENGAVDAAFFIENRICTVRGCRVFIFDKRSGALIRNDRVWSEAYARTGRDGQVIRIKEFTEAEFPAAAPPSDAALDTAPAIREVTRPAARKTP